MFVTLEVRERPKNGTNAFTEDEEKEIYRLVCDEGARYEELAAYLKVSLYTIRNVVKRQRAKAQVKPRKKARSAA